MEQALAAAHTLFAERGFAAVTMDEVAAEVGVTKPLLYNYFGNKEQLYIACMKRAGDALVATILETVGDASQPQRRAQRRPARLLRLPRRRPRRLGGALRRDPAPQRRARRPRRRLPRPPDRRWSPNRCWRSCRQAPRRRHGSKSRPSPPPCSAPPRRWRAGGCAPKRPPPSEAAELLIATVEPGLRLRSTPSAKSSRPKPKGESS